MKLTLLGTGTSFGVPQIGCDCRVCTSADPRDRRMRTGALVEDGDRRLLIDTPPELRLGLLAARASCVDAVHAIGDGVGVNGGRIGPGGAIVANVHGAPTEAVPDPDDARAEQAVAAVAVGLHHRYAHVD